MNVWLLAATTLLALTAPLLPLLVRGSSFDRLVTLELASAIYTLVLLLLAQGFSRDAYFDLALVTAPLSFGGALVFARFLERWL